MSNRFDQAPATGHRSAVQGIEISRKRLPIGGGSSGCSVCVLLASREPWLLQATLHHSTVRVDHMAVFIELQRDGATTGAAFEIPSTNPQIAELNQARSMTFALDPLPGTVSRA